jgi:DNA-binding NtrC family response regulator
MKTLSKEARDSLLAYDWPGNVRELENVIERAVILSDDGVLTPEDLPERVLQGAKGRGSLVIDNPTMTLDELEREYILKVLSYTGGQKKRASEILGINPSTLYRKLLSYGLLSEKESAEVRAME